jgi:hypothetical protein
MILQKTYKSSVVSFPNLQYTNLMKFHIKMFINHYASVIMYSSISGQWK